MAQLYVAKGR